MKRAEKTTEIKRNLDQLLSKLTENEILNERAMGYVKGGLAEGEGDGGVSIIIIPKK
jgi:hypothetical protein